MATISVINALLLLGAALVLVGIMSSLVATRFGAPLLLVFLILGMLAGEDGPGGLAFDDYQATYLIGSLALAIILFDGGLRTKAANFRGALAPAAVLATIGVVVTAVLTGAVAAYVLDLSLLEGLLLGATVASTDAAAVFFLLGTGGLQLRPRVGSLLEIESATNDPAALFLTVMLTELVLAGDGGFGWAIVMTLGQQAVLGAALGAGGGLALVSLLNRFDLPGGLHPLLSVVAAVLIYASTTHVGGSGFLAVYLAGLILGNRPVRSFPAIVRFHDAATWLCQIAMFVVLGLLVTPSHLIGYAVPALAVAVFLILFGRPIAVWLCLAPFRFSARETAFLSWVGLRGAVSIFLAAIPTLADVPHAEVYFNAAFFVVLVSLVVQGWTINPMARHLGLAMPGIQQSVSRVELDLPGQLDYEMVGYPISSGSVVLRRGAVPPWARPVFVIRQNAVLDPDDAKPLQAGDYAYFLVPPDRVHRLDRMFAAPAEGGTERPPFGELSLSGDARLGAVADLYNLNISAAERDLAVAELFAERFEDHPQLGDHVALGTATLVVRVLAGERVARAGLQLEELAGSMMPASLRYHPRVRAALRAARRHAARMRRRSPASKPAKKGRPPEGADR